MPAGKLDNISSDEEWTPVKNDLDTTSSSSEEEEKKQLHK